jgi:hypothetical protein
MHLEIARLVSILGRGWCIDDLRLRDDRIYDRASRNLQSVGCEVQLHLAASRKIRCEPAPKWDPACHAYNFLILLMKIAVEGVPIGADQDPTRKVNLLAITKPCGALVLGSHFGADPQLTFEFANDRQFELLQCR